MTKKTRVVFFFFLMKLLELEHNLRLIQKKGYRSLLVVQTFFF
jgi:hypothetical protein